MRTLEMGRMVLSQPADEKIRRVVRETLEELLLDPAFRGRVKGLIEDIETRAKN